MVAALPAYSNICKHFCATEWTAGISQRGEMSRSPTRIGAHHRISDRLSEIKWPAGEKPLTGDGWPPENGSCSTGPRTRFT